MLNIDTILINITSEKYVCQTYILTTQWNIKNNENIILTTTMKVEEGRSYSGCIKDSSPYQIYTTYINL